MNERQRQAMIEFHRKAEAAYSKFGKYDQAKQARKMREQIEKKTAVK